MFASFPTVPKTQRPKSLKSTFSITPLSFDAPSPENPCEYPHKSYIARNQSLTYISAADSMGLSSFKFVVGSEIRIFLQQRAYRPFKVIQGR